MPPSGIRREGAFYLIHASKSKGPSRKLPGRPFAFSYLMQVLQGVYPAAIASS